MKVRDCRDVRALLGAYADRELAPHEAAAVAAHLAACAGCQAEYAALEHGDRAVLALDAAEPSVAALGALAARVRTQIAAEAAPEGAPGPERAPVHARRGWRSRVGGLTWPRLVPVAAAAVVLLLVLRFESVTFMGSRREDEAARSRETPPATLQSTSDAGDADAGDAGHRDAPVAGSDDARAGGAGEARAPAPASEPGAAGKLQTMAKSAAEGARDEGDIMPSSPSRLAPAVPPAAAPANEAVLTESWVETERAAPARAAPGAADAAHFRGGRSAVGSSVMKSEGDYRVGSFPSPADLAPARDLLARGEPARAGVVLDSLLATWPAGDPSPGARGARALRLAAAEAAAGPDPDRASARNLAALYERFSREEAEVELAASWAARAIELTVGAGTDEPEAAASAPAEPADCRLLAARIRDFLSRFPDDPRADSLAAAGARLPCAP